MFPSLVECRLFSSRRLEKIFANNRGLFSSGSFGDSRDPLLFSSSLCWGFLHSRSTGTLFCLDSRLYDDVVFTLQVRPLPPS